MQSGKTHRMIQAVINAPEEQVYVAILYQQQDYILNMLKPHLEKWDTGKRTATLKNNKKIIFIDTPTVEPSRGRIIGSTAPVYADHHALEVEYNWVIQQLERFGYNKQIIL